MLLIENLLTISIVVNATLTVLYGSPRPTVDNCLLPLSNHNFLVKDLRNSVRGIENDV